MSIAITVHYCFVGFQNIEVGLIERTLIQQIQVHWLRWLKATQT